MKIYSAYLMSLVFPLGIIAETPSDIPLPSKRAEVIEVARALVIPPPPASAQDVTALNPFNPPPPVDHDSDGAGDSVKPLAGASDREVLKKMAEGVAPSGMMQMGDQLVLLFGEKKLKVGDRIPVNYNGATYDLELGAIERTNFTLRLRKEEITRPIKVPYKKP